MRDKKIEKIERAKKQGHTLYTAWGIIKWQSNDGKRDSEL